MKEKDFSGADLPFPLFSLEASVQLEFLTLIEAQKSSKERPLLLFHSSIQPQTLLFTYKVLPVQAKDIDKNSRPRNKKWRNPPGT